jgi:hypothetical protein
MKRLIFAFALALSLLPSSPRAQVAMQIQVGLPVAPPLVVIQPGIQVVENYGEEVFFVGGWYWCRRGDVWYRARTPRASFVYVEPMYVPTRLSYLPPPGHYRHWNRVRAREERHWWKEHEHDRRRAWKEHDARRTEWQRERSEHRAVLTDRGPAPAARGHGSVLAPPHDRGQTSVVAPSSDRGHGHGDRHHERHGGDHDGR